ncbi:hypothetical protein BSL78_22284 [Apostichopus japonicus]|uniref:RNA-directed DNA polymerase from mobile element jockey-like n=1 Tax=Stichopus japonicus TaxID=307972 RepID=A0A2G8JYR0_STIJA|nr:hypothetical protein BSL78_22284 [Apostichopus japonicus]
MTCVTGIFFSIPNNSKSCTSSDGAGTGTLVFDRQNTSVPVPAPCDDVLPPFKIAEHDVRRAFKGLKERKAAGPDGIPPPRLLRRCSDPLATVFTDIFNWSLRLQKVPNSLKEATIIPVPKNNSASSLKDYRPVALTSVIMKSFEKHVLKYLCSKLPSDLTLANSPIDQIEVWTMQYLLTFMKFYSILRTRILC